MLYICIYIWKKTKTIYTYLAGMKVIASLLFPRHQLLPKVEPRAIFVVKGNNKLAISRISSQ